MEKPYRSISNLNLQSTFLQNSSKRVLTSRKVTSDYYSKEDITQQLITLKLRINELEDLNKKLKAKITSLEVNKPFLKSQITVSELDKAKIYSAYCQVSQENSLLKKELLSQKKFIKELLKAAPASLTEIKDPLFKQLKSLETFQKSLKVNKSQVSSKDFEKLSEKKPFYIQSEIEKIGEISKSIVLNSKENNLEEEEIWCVMNPNNKKSISFSEFSNGARALNLDFPSQDLDLFFKFYSSRGYLSQSAFLSSLSY